MLIDAGKLAEDTSLFSPSSSPRYENATSSAPPYFRSHRWSKNLTYTLHGFVEGAMHQVSLGFAEIYGPACVIQTRIMDIKVRGSLNYTKTGLDVFASAGCDTAHVETFTLAPDDSGTFTIEIIGSKQNAMIAMIEISIPTLEPTPSPTPEPTPDPTPQPTPDPTPGPTPDATPQPTPDPTPGPTPDPTPQPIPDPTPEPTLDPTPQPAPDPTPEPTLDPTPQPAPDPTPEPTLDPTPQPTPDPTPEPTPDPTPQPTPDPTSEPTQDPTPSQLLILRQNRHPTLLHNQPRILRRHRRQHRHRTLLHGQLHGQLRILRVSQHLH
jgi:hypothetical protein